MGSGVSEARKKGGRLSMNITYYVQRYRPEFEAISQEVQLLARHFEKQAEIKIHDLHWDGLTRFRFSPKEWSLHFAWYPLFFPRTFLLSKSSDLNHIYTSLGDTPYLPLLDLRRTLLTAAASCQEEKVRKRLPWLRKLKKIVVESERQQQLLLRWGISPEKVVLISPGVELGRFLFQKPPPPFTLLYASCPTREKDFSKRGMQLIAETAPSLPSLRWHLAWRGGGYLAAKKLLGHLSQIALQNEIVADMNVVYGKAHATLIPYTQFDDYLKLVPNSALESLAAGKPLLVSSQTGIASLVRREQCGVVFEPTPDSLGQAILLLQKKYGFYQKRCRAVAEKHFSQEIFLQKYQKLYEEMQHD